MNCPNLDRFAGSSYKIFCTLASVGLLSALLIDAAGSIFDVSADPLPEFLTGNCGTSGKGDLIAAQEFGDFHGADWALGLGADIGRIVHRQLVRKLSD